MFLPLQEKPKGMVPFGNMLFTIPNVITKEMAESLRAFASDPNVSGLHRRTSKVPEVCDASFYTCLVFRYDNPIYEILDNAWEKFVKSSDINITFIEPISSLWIF